MSDPILLFLALDVVALLLLGVLAAAVGPAICGFLAAGFCALGLLLCLPPLLMHVQLTALVVPIGPPGLPLHLVLDSLSTFFLFVIFMAGTAIAAFQAATVPPAKADTLRATVFCIAGTTFALLAGDGVSLAIGLAIAGAAVGDGQRRQLLVPLLLLAAACLLTPAGYPPRFDAIRAAPVDLDHATAAVALTVVAVAALAWPTLARSNPAATQAASRSWIRDALTAGVMIPTGSYLMLRVAADLAISGAPAWWGFVLVLLGSMAAMLLAWCSAGRSAGHHQDIDEAIAALVRRQAGLAMTGIGLALIAHAADLPGSASLALAATFLLAIGSGCAGTLTSLVAHTIGIKAGTYRLSRLGGLIHVMPATSAALTAGILALAALPPGLGFACLWLLFQSILTAPRSGGLLSQLPLALTAAALAVSAALATTASVRLIGIAILGRPRTPRGSGAQESALPVRSILLALGGVSLLAGVLPGPTLWLLAEPAIHALIQAPPAGRISLALLSGSRAVPSYLALPVLALLVFATGMTVLMSRLVRKTAKPVGLWADGMPPPDGLPFGEPAAQSTGAGFLPTLPRITLPRVPRLPRPAFRGCHVRCRGNLAGARGLRCAAADAGDRPMIIVLSLLAQILHIGLMVAAAPTAAGAMDWLDARLTGRAGPPLLLPWRDLVRWSRKTPVILDNVSVVSRFAPQVALGSMLAAAALVPSFTLGMALSPLADVLVIVSLLSTARMAVALAGLDAGAAMPALIQQEISTAAVLAEPALMLAVVTLALMAGSFNLDLIIGQQREGMLLPATASAVASTALLALVFADTCSGNREPDAIFSGIDLAMARLAVWLRRLVWADLIGGLFLPIGMATTDDRPLAWLTGLATWSIRTGVFMLCLSAIQSRIGRIPRHSLLDLLGVSALLALLATIMVLASAGLA